LDKDERNRDLLKETNKLLKDFGSKTHFVEKEKSISYQLKSIKEVFSKSLASTNTKEEKKEEIDKSSHLYLKNSLYLNKYKEKLTENTKFIWNNLFKLLRNENLREYIFLKRSVIKQNIILFKARLEGVSVSYTFIKK
jgi:hypothetical protein